MKKKSIRGKFNSCFMAGIAVLTSFGMLFGAGCNPEGTPEEKPTYTPIKSVKTIAFMDLDGPKTKAIICEYEQTLTADVVSEDDYEISVNDPQNYDYMGDGKVGEILKLYVNSEPAISEDGGTESGNYVVMELFTDYLCASEQSYVYGLLARVTQVKDITLNNGDVIVKGDTYSTNTVNNKFTKDSFEIADLDGFQYFTDDPGDFGSDGAAFEWKNCFNQQDGLYYDENLAYALYVPDDYHEGGNYGMVTLQNPAANKGTHPLIALLATRSPAYYISEKAQQIAKEVHGLDGLIVVVPVVTERVNDNGGTPAEYEAVVHLWDHLIDEYNINTNYIYGSGQSVGGMILLETQRNRDNFFAGLLLYEDQWAQNYFIDTLFVRDMIADSKAAATATMHYPRTDSYITWDYSLDTEGEKVYDGHDPYNYYYLVSDDNVLVLCCDDNNLCVDTWQEMDYLYSDLAGDHINKIEIDGSGTLDEQNASLNSQLEDKDGTRNINWVVFENGVKGYAARKLDASYEWLLSQTRTDEVERAKLDLNKPFVAADTQIQNDSRKSYFVKENGDPIYFITGAAGAGTQFYNTCWLNLKTVADAAPGWLPDGMSWDKGVSGAHIEEITAISSTAFAIKYDKDMSGLVSTLKGDAVMGLDGKVRDDIKIELDPFEFYDANGNKINCTVTNIYVNSSASVKSGATKCSGSGNYVIVELSASASSAVKVLQRTTLRTDTLIASALPYFKEVK